jgi:hypothetical protein
VGLETEACALTSGFNQALLAALNKANKGRKSQKRLRSVKRADPIEDGKSENEVIREEITGIANGSNDDVMKRKARSDLQGCWVLWG